MIAWLVVVLALTVALTAALAHEVTHDMRYSALCAWWICGRCSVVVTDEALYVDPSNTRWPHLARGVVSSHQPTTEKEHHHG